jgi:hypothetical protein
MSQRKIVALCVTAAASILVAAFTILRLAQHQPRHTALTDHPEPLRVPQDGAAQLLADSAGALVGTTHLTDADIAHLVGSPLGREVLCGQIGIRGNGLDDASFQSLEVALSQQKELEPPCIEPLVHRLENALVERQLHTLRGTPPIPDTIDPLEVSLLRRHPQSVSTLLRKLFGLGGADPDSNVLSVLSILRLQTSCVDLKSSIAAMKHSNDPMTSAFSRTRRRICRTA